MAAGSDGKGPGSKPAKRTPAQAAKAAMAQVLRERVALVSELDTSIAALIDQALATILGQLAQAPSDYQLWVLPRLTEGIRRVAEQLAASAGAKASTAVGQAWTLGQRVVDEPVAAAQAALPLAPPAAAPRPQAHVAMPAPDLRQLRAMQAFTTELIGGATADTVGTRLQHFRHVSG